MRAGVCAVLAGLVLGACVRHEPYPSYAYYPYPYPAYSAPYAYGHPYYAPRSHSGFSIVIGKGRHHHHGHHGHRWHRHHRHWR